MPVADTPIEATRCRTRADGVVCLTISEIGARLASSAV
jgi:hypothetical protein